MNTTLDELETMLIDAYENLAGATDDAFRNGEAAIAQRNVVMELRLNGLADGTIQGKNEEMREASFRALCGHEIGKLLELESWQRQTSANLDLARMEVDRVRALLRLMELAHGTAQS